MTERKYVTIAPGVRVRTDDNVKPGEYLMGNERSGGMYLSEDGKHIKFRRPHFGFVDVKSYTSDDMPKDGTIGSIEGGAKD